MFGSEPGQRALRAARGRPGPAAVAVVTVAVEAAIPVAIVAIHAALETTVPPAFPPPNRLHMGQDGKPALLAVIQGLVERIGGIRDLLHGRRRGRHVVGALAQPRHRIVRLLLRLRIIRRRVHPRIGAIDPQLGEIPHRGLDRRPQLFLVGVSFSPAWTAAIRASAKAARSSGFIRIWS